jgi:hypothetical protein
MRHLIELESAEAVETAGGQTALSGGNSVPSGRSTKVNQEMSYYTTERTQIK